MSDNRRSRPTGVDELFEAATRDGALSAEARDVLEIADLGASVQAALGGSVEDVPSSEVLLVTLMPDDSGSIASAGNVERVCEGHNAVLDALARCQQRDDVLVHTRYLNGKLLFPYTPLQGAVRMDRSNYSADQWTPLYDQMVVLLGTVVAKTQQLADAGIAVRTVTLVVTDGEDTSSRHHKAKDVRALVRDLLAGGNHIVAAMGIDDGRTNFRTVFERMGILDQWVLTPKNDAAAIRRAFQVFSQSAVRASQATQFAGTALGGFLN